jgi:hypothetical protein
MSKTLTCYIRTALSAYYRSPDPFFRPQAKDLDLLFMDMNVQEAEPSGNGVHNMFNKPKEITTEDMLYEVFPKHIADALKAGQKVEPESHDTVTVVFSDIGKTQCSHLFMR